MRPNQSSPSAPEGPSRGEATLATGEEQQEGEPGRQQGQRAGRSALRDETPTLGLRVQTLRSSVRGGRRLPVATAASPGGGRLPAPQLLEGPTAGESIIWVPGTMVTMVATFTVLNLKTAAPMTRSLPRGTRQGCWRQWGEWAGGQGLLKASAPPDFGWRDLRRGWIWSLASFTHLPAPGARLAFPGGGEGMCLKGDGKQVCVFWGRRRLCLVSPVSTRPTSGTGLQGGCCSLGVFWFSGFGLCVWFRCRSGPGRCSWALQF